MVIPVFVPLLGNYVVCYLCPVSLQYLDEEFECVLGWDATLWICEEQRACMQSVSLLGNSLLNEL